MFKFSNLYYNTVKFIFSFKRMNSADEYVKPDATVKRVLRIFTVRNLGVLALITLLLAGSALTAYYVVMNSENAGPGILLTINLYDISVEEKKLVDVTSKILKNPDVLMYLEINAITPSSLESEEAALTMTKITAKPKKTVFIRLDKLLEISREWISIYSLREGNPEETYSGLIIRLFIYNGSSGDILFEAYDSITYKPVEITREKSIRVTMSLVRDSLKPIKLYVEHAIVRQYEVLLLQASIEEFGKGIEPSGRCGIWWIERELVTLIGPANLTTQLPSDYFNNPNGVLYVKTPVLIVSNLLSLSGVVSASINIGISQGNVGVYPTLTSGAILNSTASGLIPNVKLWRGSGFTWGGSTYYFGYNAVVEPLQSKWIWIWTRPMFAIYKVYRVTCTGRGSELIRVYIRDDAESAIYDVLTSGLQIVGGMNDGLPHDNLMRMFFNGTELINPKIPNTMLADGILQPREYMAFELIFPYFDVCESDFEVGIPVGAAAALAVCIGLGYGPNTPACLAAIKFSSAFQVSISAQGPSIRISGNIVNHGMYDGRGYNVSEVVYMSISQYQYKSNTCYYNVPAGIYFRLE